MKKCKPQSMMAYLFHLIIQIQTQFHHSMIYTVYNIVEAKKTYNNAIGYSDKQTITTLNKVLQLLNSHL